MTATTWLLACRGPAGSGKSTLSRALSRELGWPLIDKDDCKDILDGRTPDAGELAYAVMFSVVRRQVLQGLSVICDSPLTYSTLYDHAREIATEKGAQLAILECCCPDEDEWRRRIEGRKALALPVHHQTDWASFQEVRRAHAIHAAYPVSDPLLVVDTTRPIAELVVEVVAGLAAV